MSRPLAVQLLLGILWWHRASGQAAMIHTMVVRGAGSYLNGRYEPSKQLSNGTRCYEKNGREDVFLCRSPSGHWLAQPKAQVGTDVGYMMSSKRFLDAPLGAGPWSEYRGESVLWKEKRAITVQADVRAISMTIAFMAVGSLVVIALVVKMALAMRPEIRDMLYLVLCAVFTTFISYTALKAIFNLFPHGSSLLELVVSLALTAICWAFISFGSWKCQFSFHRVASICWLASFGSAYGGIAAVTAAQRLAMASLKAEIQPKVLAPRWAAFTGVFAVACLTFMILGILRSAANNWRFRSMQEEPAVLWSTKKMITRYGCWPFGKSDDVLLKFTWNEYVKWGEDVAGILIGSFALYQTVLFLLTERLPAVEESFYLYGKEAQKFWIASGVALMITAIGVGYAKTLNMEASSRFARIAAFSGAMVGSWCCFRVLNFIVMPFFPDSDLAPTSVAFMAALLVVLVVYVTGSRLAGATFGWGVCTLAIGVGNVCGLAWGRLFQASLDSTSKGILQMAGCEDSLPANHGLHFLLSALLVAVAAAVWLVAILPRRNLGVDDHQKMIQSEQSSFLTE